MTNPEIQQKQIDYAYQYGLKGFAIYYYWFSVNTITGKNTIMERGYENFFNGKVKIPKGFKLYFIPCTGDICFSNGNWQFEVLGTAARRGLKPRALSNVQGIDTKVITINARKTQASRFGTAHNQQVPTRTQGTKMHA